MGTRAKLAASLQQLGFHEVQPRQISSDPHVSLHEQQPRHKGLVLPCLLEHRATLGETCEVLKVDCPLAPDQCERFGMLRIGQKEQFYREVVAHGARLVRRR